MRQKSAVQCDFLPVSTPAISASDMALLSDKDSRHKAALCASIPENIMMEWQENARRSLEFVSILETLLASISSSVFGGVTAQPEFSQTLILRGLCLYLFTQVPAFDSRRASRLRLPTLRWRGETCYSRSLTKLRLSLEAFAAHAAYCGRLTLRLPRCRSSSLSAGL